jgi:hypothetical protein
LPWSRILNMLTQACLVAPLNYMELVKPTRIHMQVFALLDNNVELGFIPSIQSCLCNYSYNSVHICTHLGTDTEYHKIQYIMARKYKKEE